MIVWFKRLDTCAQILVRSKKVIRAAHAAALIEFSSGEAADGTTRATCGAIFLPTGQSGPGSRGRVLGSLLRPGTKRVRQPGYGRAHASTPSCCETVGFAARTCPRRHARGRPSLTCRSLVMKGSPVRVRASASLNNAESLVSLAR